jgi:hypothetical protein
MSIVAAESADTQSRAGQREKGFRAFGKVPYTLTDDADAKFAAAPFDRVSYPCCGPAR